MAKRKFVVIINEETQEDVSSFIEYVKQQRFGWWHWVSNVWLLTTRNQQMSAREIRDKVREITGGKVTVVIEVTSVTWAAFGPTGEKSISKWIRDTWSKS